MKYKKRSDTHTLNDAEKWQRKADKLDQCDALKEIKDLFVIPDGIIYLDGNSLGPMPLACKVRATDVVEKQWAQDLITSWNKHDWIGLPLQVGSKIAPLLGADPEQVICCDSISVNLFKLLSAAVTKNQPRHIILSEHGNFPTDLYMVEGFCQQIGEDKAQLKALSIEQILAFMDKRGEEVAVLMLTHVNFRTGKIHDMQTITQLAHDKGILVIWDLAHSAGIVPLSLDACDVDFAVGCGYKYLNGGPGAPAFVYVNRVHLQDTVQPLSGWMGHAAPFEFDPSYRPAANIQKMLCGTPNVVSMSILDAALDVFDGIQITQIRHKSMAMLSFVESLIEQQPTLDTLKLISPTQPEVRGSQLAYQHAAAYQICQALIEYGVVADFRAPNILRLGFGPLYLSFNDCLQAVQVLHVVMADKIFEQPQYSVQNAVT